MLTASRSWRYWTPKLLQNACWFPIIQLPSHTLQAPITSSSPSSLLLLTFLHHNNTNIQILILVSNWDFCVWGFCRTTCPIAGLGPPSDGMPCLSWKALTSHFLWRSPSIIALPFSTISKLVVLLYPLLGGSGVMTHPRSTSGCHCWLREAFRNICSFRKIPRTDCASNL